MWIQPVDSTEFLQVVGAARVGHADELASLVRERWTPQQLCQMLQHEESDVRKLACVVLGLIADRRVENCLAAVLRDEDPAINEMAEHALWSIWFRAGSADAERHFCRGIEALEQEKTGDAVDHFTRAIDADPKFSEAYNQRAIAYYLQDQFIEAMDDSRRTLELAPCHFGAMAGLGHCHAQLGNFADAGRAYRRALQINPRMHTIAAALGRIGRCFTCV